MRCELRGSVTYCSTGHGICCASCEKKKGCGKACLNGPERCGYSVQVSERPANYVLPVPRLWKGGTLNADAAEKK